MSRRATSSRPIESTRSQPADRVHAAAVEVDLRLRDVHSLKAKRHRLKRLSAALRSAYSVAFAETDHQDQWQRATVAVGIVSPHASQLDMAVYSIERFIDGFEGVEVIEIGVSYLEDPRT